MSIATATITKPDSARATLRRYEMIKSVQYLAAKNWKASVVIAATNVSVKSDRSWY